MTLRATAELSVRRAQSQVPGTVAAAPVTPAPGSVAASLAQARREDEEWPAAPALAVSALAVLLGAGWLLQRRRRLAQRVERHAEAVTPPTAPLVQEPMAQEAAGQPVEATPALVLQAQEELAAAPVLSSPAPLERQRRHSHLMGVAAQKRLIKSLMWVRTVAGVAAIVAAIAVVVFWAIETTDLRAGETGLTKPLLVLLLAGWAASWGAGQLANQLHRAFFGRVHPKFDD
jgi:hypothetical protein